MLPLAQPFVLYQWLKTIITHFYQNNIPTGQSNMNADINVFPLIFTLIRLCLSCFALYACRFEFLLLDDMRLHFTWITLQELNKVSPKSWSSSLLFPQHSLEPANLFNSPYPSEQENHPDYFFDKAKEQIHDLSTTDGSFRDLPPTCPDHCLDLTGDSRISRNKYYLFDCFRYCSFWERN